MAQLATHFWAAPRFQTHPHFFGSHIFLFFSRGIFACTYIYIWIYYIHCIHICIYNIHKKSFFGAERLNDIYIYICMCAYTPTPKDGSF